MRGIGGNRLSWNLPCHIRCDFRRCIPLGRRPYRQSEELEDRGYVIGANQNAYVCVCVRQIQVAILSAIVYCNWVDTCCLLV